jgi:signal transduction histidine kinase
MLKYNLDKKNILLQKNIPDDLPKLYVDPDQLQQIIINLVLNAIDAISENGQIIVSASLEKEKLDNYNIIFEQCSMGKNLGKWIKIEVEDNGTGIPEELQNKIFDPFFTTKSKGSGLGLSIVYQLVNENCGKMDFVSKEKKGTKFMVLLPYKK